MNNGCAYHNSIAVDEIIAHGTNDLPEVTVAPCGAPSWRFIDRETAENIDRISSTRGYRIAAHIHVNFSNYRI